MMKDRGLQRVKVDDAKPRSKTALCGFGEPRSVVHRESNRSEQSGTSFVVPHSKTLRVTIPSQQPHQAPPQARPLDPIGVQDLGKPEALQTLREAPWSAEQGTQFRFRRSGG